MVWSLYRSNWRSNKLNKWISKKNIDAIKTVGRLCERWIDTLFQVSPDADEEEQLMEGGQADVVIVQVKLKE